MRSRASPLCRPSPSTRRRRSLVPSRVGTPPPGPPDRVPPRAPSQFAIRHSANTQKIPEWARLDAGARYTARFYDTNVTFRANVNNLLDRNYWAGSYFVDGIVILSSPRTVLVSATVDF